MPSPWRDQLSPASYKGVKFFIDSHTLTGGRRIVDHLFPYIDKAFTEDMGQKQNRFSMEAYILGEDYFGQRDSFIKALNAEGAGILVHPYLGEKTVEAVDYSMNETSREGGVVRFSLTFHETSRVASPNLDEDLTGQLKEKAKEVDEATIDSFSGFDVLGFSEKAIAQAIRFVDQGTAQLEKAMAMVPQTDLGLSELAYSIRIFKATARDLILAPLKLARYVVDSANLLGASLNADRIIPVDEDGRELTRLDPALDYIQRKQENRRIFAPLIKAGDAFEEILGNTPSKIAQINNQRLVKLLYASTALTQYSITAAQTEYATLEDALEERDYIVREITRILEDPLITDRLYESFQDLISLLVKSIPSLFSQPKRISKIELQAGIPSVVLAYDLYESLELEQDIVLRNRVTNPSLIPAGSVEVISGD